MNWRAVLLFASAACSGPVSTLGAQATVAPPPGFDAYVEQVMKTFDVPGIAVAIVKDGKVVLARGYGVRRLGQPERVDASTRFGIASNTKLFTATALALLVEEGKLEWDEPVIRYLPDFAMSDPFVTRELTVRDLLVHRSGLGLGAGDLLWWPPSTYDRKEIARRLRYIPLATSFRSAYAYDNVLYLVAGRGHRGGVRPDLGGLRADRILAPVGMTASDVRHSGAARAAATWRRTHARGGRHRAADRAVRQRQHQSRRRHHAGATDMAKWMIVQLDSGRTADGRAALHAASDARALARA